ncbi:putative candidate secreted effector protein [Blumeria hordei DH14]|uniref:Putative candidate secreted effector protein n=1 Tax=Blumeria graminis f. sp. hordei (strain DH14) TaxID=546991 RepID=N1J7C4_BLUG1|nr:putative candidate secreted effector protein [Blumeria hordei DH14]
MRLSRIAMIFQSASFCTISLAALFSRHPQENDKVFFCDVEVEQEQYSSIQREKINDRGTIRTLNGEFDRLVADTGDQRVVQFNDIDNGGYEYFRLPTLMHNRYVGNDIAMTEYILIIDRQGRACSMMMKKSATPFEDRYRSATRRCYNLCEVGTKNPPRWRQI